LLLIIGRNGPLALDRIRLTSKPRVANPFAREIITFSAPPPLREGRNKKILGLELLIFISLKKYSINLY
jgi:hypothetical protein